MSDRVTLSLPTINLQARIFRSHSFNPPPTLAAHRSRRTLSLPAREKPSIPPVISETPETYRPDHEEYLEEQKRESLARCSCEEIGWFAPIAGLFLSLVLFGWACLLSMSIENKRISLDS